MSGVVLVTGGAGFIGSHLCEALVTHGRRVRVLDDFSSGNAGNLARAWSSIVVVEGSIESRAAVARAVDGVSAIAHLAARSSVAESMAAEDLYRRVNVGGTATLVAEAHRAGVARIVFAASSSAYGDHDAPHDEAMEPRPMSPYGATKVECERMLRTLAQEPGAPDTAALRFFNVYGTRQDPNNAYAAVIPRFMTRIASRLPATIFGDGEQTRDFVHVSDAARAVIAAIDAPARLGGAVVNVGTGRATSIRELAETIGRVLEKPAKLDFQPARAGEVRHSVATVARARELLGFTARVPLEEGLATMA
ncbi:MAG: NAD-dependent epimerase/dehydratase family protein [Limnohabitans sp.]|nr:NAD-dependent epimerase/dehydratase family protein [Limnohabitans sp.]